MLVISNTYVCGQGGPIGCRDAVAVILPEGAAPYISMKNARQVLAFKGRGFVMTPAIGTVTTVIFVGRPFPERVPLGTREDVAWAFAYTDEQRRILIEEIKTVLAGHERQECAIYSWDRPCRSMMEYIRDDLTGGNTAIEGGEFVAAGDRLEILRPGYAAVEHQQSAPRFAVDIEGIQLTADRRTLILSTTPHFAAVNYAIALRDVRPSPGAAAIAHELPQLPDMDLQYDLNGVEATWEPRVGAKSNGWLPHVDLDVSRAFTTSSAWHDEFWQQLGKPGTLQLRTAVNLRSMLRPAVQVGSTIDYQLPDEKVTLTLSRIANSMLLLMAKRQCHPK